MWTADYPEVSLEPSPPPGCLSHRQRNHEPRWIPWGPSGTKIQHARALRPLGGARVDRHRPNQPVCSAEAEAGLAYGIGALGDTHVPGQILGKMNRAWLTLDLGTAVDHVTMALDHECRGNRQRCPGGEPHGNWLCDDVYENRRDFAARHGPLAVMSAWSFHESAGGRAVRLGPRPV